ALLGGDQVDGSHDVASSMASPAATIRRLDGTPPAASGLICATAPTVTGIRIAAASAWSKPGMSTADPQRTARTTSVRAPWELWKSRELRTSAAIRATPSTRAD